MANDRSRLNLFATFREKFTPNDVNPTSIINLGLGTMTQWENEQGVVATSYDKPVFDDDNKASKVTNKDFNTIHRLLEVYGDAIAGTREVTRAMKVRQHLSLFPQAYHSFVETFYDTKFTEDSSSECVFNGIWSAPTSPAPAVHNPVSGSTLTFTGDLVHNAYEGSLKFETDATLSTHAGTYRTKDLLSTGLTVGTGLEDYYAVNSFDGISATHIFNPRDFALDVATNIELMQSGVCIIVAVHANNAFWDAYWDTDEPADTDITSAQAAASPNRIVVYPWESTGVMDNTKRLIYLPHVPETDVLDGTRAADASDLIMGKIINVEEPVYKANEGIRHVITNSPAYYRDISTNTTELFYPAVGVMRTAEGAPSAFINETEVGVGRFEIADWGALPDSLRVEITLGPDAKIYSWSIHTIRLLDWIHNMMGTRYDPS